MKNGALFIVLSLALMVSGCARKNKVPVAAAPVVGSVEIGQASWYGHPYHGRRSASGEVYDMEKMTAAHRTLPFGTLVSVKNLQNRKSVKVRIIDRGPFVDGRIIDLSHAAAGAIGMLGPGTARVRVEIISLSTALSINEVYAVQVGAFKDRSNAERLRKSMEHRYGTAKLVYRQADVPLWRVLVGRESSLDGANRLAEKIRSEHMSAFVVRVDE